jgi:hypothetical protein
VAAHAAALLTVLRRIRSRRCLYDESVPIVLRSSWSRTAFGATLLTTSRADEAVAIAHRGICEASGLSRLSMRLAGSDRGGTRKRVRHMSLGCTSPAGTDPAWKVTMIAMHNATLKPPSNGELGLDPRANEVRNVGPRVSRIF